MDRRLQDYARQRRETPGAPTELHPVNRKLLLQQVRDFYPVARPPSRPINVRAVWWAWARLATVGIGTAAVVVMAFFAWREFQVGPSQMARLEPAKPEATTFSADKASSLSMAARSEVRVDAINSERVSEPQGLLAKNPLADREGDRPEWTDGAKKAAVVGASAAPAAHATPAPSPQSAGFASSPAAGLTLDFVQTSMGEGASAVTELTRSRRLELSPRSKAADLSPALLRRFQINAVDGQLDVRDGDGSVYRGSILPVTLGGEPGAAVPGSRPVGGSPIEGVQGNSLNSQAMIAGLYRFQAQGSNRSLRQWVVMNGYLSNAAGSMKDADPLPVNQQPTAASALGRSQAWEIQSRIQLGTQTPTTLRARQAPIAQTPP